MTLHIGLVGCGAVSRVYYADALATLAQEQEGVAVRALFDPDGEALQQLATRFPKVTLSTTWDGFLAAAPDFAIVASPPQYHAQQCIALLEAGISVFCEKPLALKDAEAEAIAIAAENSEATMAVGMVRRHLPAAQSIAWILHSGALGALRRVRWLEGNSFRWPVQNLAYFRPEVGGVLSDIGVHVLDLLQWWLGELSLQRYEDDNAGGVETNCLVRLRDRSDAEITLRLTRDDDPPVACRIECEGGTILWREGHPTALELIPASGALGPADSQQLQSILATANAKVWSFERAFVAQLQDAIEARRQERAPLVTARGARAAITLIEACYANRQSLPMPWCQRDDDAMDGARS